MCTGLERKFGQHWILFSGPIEFGQVYMTKRQHSLKILKETLKKTKNKILLIINLKNENLK